MGKLKSLKGGKVTRGLREQKARQHFVLRQSWLRGEGENGLRGRPGHFNLGRDVASLGLGNEIELRREVAGETEATAGKIEALADNGGEPATAQVEGADCDRGFGGARQSKISAEFGVDPAAAYENAVRCRDSEVKCCVEGGGPADATAPDLRLRLLLGRQPRPHLRRRGNMACPREWPDCGRQAVRNRNVHRHKVDPARHTRLPHDRALYAEIEVRHRGDYLACEEFGLVGAQPNLDWKARRRVERYPANGA